MRRVPRHHTLCTCQDNISPSPPLPLPSETRVFGGCKKQKRNKAAAGRQTIGKGPSPTHHTTTTRRDRRPRPASRPLYSGAGREIVAAGPLPTFPLSYRPTTLSPGLLAPAFRVLSQAPPLTCERRRPSKAAGTRSPPRRRTPGKLPSLRADGLRRPLPCASTPGRRHLRPSARAASLQSHDPLKRGLVAQATRALAAAPFCDRAH